MTQVPSRPELHAVLDELTRAEGRDDPYPRYRRLREEAPVLRAPDGAVVLTRYADCDAVVRDPAFGHDDAAQDFAAAGLDLADHPGLRTFAQSILVLNPPQHTRLRRLVSGAFTARRVARLEPAVAALVDQQVEQLAGESDFVTAFTFPLPVAVIGELLGIPEADRAQFQPLVRDWTLVLDLFTPEILAGADAAAAQIRDYLGELLAHRRRRPADDLLSAMVAQESAGDRMSDDEALTMAALLFAAGFETTTHLLGNGLVALLENPEQAARLREQPDLAATATEELLRYDSSVQILGRVARQDVDLAGFALPAGERVVMYLGAANRDPARFTDPDRLDLGRREAPPMSFGGGIHYCLGSPLARLEARLALPALLRRYPALALAGAAQRRDSLTLRGYLSLPVRAA